MTIDSQPDIPPSDDSSDDTHPPEDHRTRTAARRREQMRRRLLESAMLVFAEKGVDASVIDDVISTAGVSRGTFYKYFASNRDLMVAANDELCKELLSYVLDRVSEFSDPAVRAAIGARTFLETALAFPLLARFTRSVGLESRGPTALLYEYLPHQLREGIDQGRFLDMPTQVALDLISGGVLLCIARATDEEIEPGYTHHVVAAALRGLGLEESEAWALANQDIAPLEVPEDSLLWRSNQRFRARDSQSDATPETQPRRGAAR